MGQGNKVCLQGLGHLTKMATRPIYGKNSFKIFLLWNQWASNHGTWYAALGYRPIIICSHDDLFYGKVKFGPFGKITVQRDF